jgi:hypothetical protein
MNDGRTLCVEYQRENRLELRRRLAGVAARQSGYSTHAQVLEVGYSYPAQKYNADRGSSPASGGAEEDSNRHPSPVRP